MNTVYFQGGFQMEYKVLSNGVKMPQLGYGVYQVTKEDSFLDPESRWLSFSSSFLRSVIPYNVHNIALVHIPTENAAVRFKRHTSHVARILHVGIFGKSVREILREIF